MCVNQSKKKFKDARKLQREFLMQRMQRVDEKISEG